MTEYFSEERADLNDTQPRMLGQNNPPGEADQSTARYHEHHRQQFARAMPWIVLGVWLLADLAVVLYWASQEWGFLGDILLIIGFAGNVLGLTAWLTAWLALGDRSFSRRVAYFCLGMAGVLAMISVQIEWWSSDLQLLAALGQHMVATGTLLVLVRGRGYRLNLASRAASPEEAAGRRWWQFSIGEVFLVTTAAGLYIGLSIFSQTATLRASTTILIVCAALMLTLLTTVGCRSFWRAIGVSSLVCLVAGVVAALINPWGTAFDAMTLLNPETWIVVAAYGGTGNLCLIVAVALLRPWGYRLTRD